MPRITRLKLIFRRVARAPAAPGPRAPMVALAAALGVALLGGCAAIEGYNRGIATVQLAQADELPSDQINRIDGTYKGLTYLLAAGSPNCPPPSTGTLDVGDRTLIFAYTPAVIFTAAVQPDGGIHGVVGRVRLDGQVGNGFMQFTVSSPACTSRYDFRYVI